MKHQDSLLGSLPADKPRNSMFTIVFSLGIVGILILGPIVWMTQKNNNSKKLYTLSDWTTATVILGTLKDTLTLNGTVLPSSTRSIKAQVAGIVQQVYVQKGDDIRGGQLLFSIQADDSKQYLADEQANLLSLQNKVNILGAQHQNNRLLLINTLNRQSQLLASAQQELRTSQELFNLGAVAQVDLDTAQAKIIGLQDEVFKAKSELQAEDLNYNGNIQDINNQTRLSQQKIKLLQKKLEQTQFYANASGRVTDINIEVGQLLNVGDTLITVMDTQNLNVVANIDEFNSKKLQLGQESTITVEGVDYAAEVSKISNQVIKQGEQSSIPVTLSFVQKPNNLRYNASAVINITTSEHVNVPMLPKGPYLNGGNSSIFLIKGQQATRVDLKVGAMDIKNIEAKNLNVGDQVIISSYSDFADQDTIVLAQKGDSRD